MIDAGGPQFDRQLYARPWAELVAMHPQPEAGRSSRLEDVAGLVGVEGVRRVGLAEHVDPARVRSRCMQHRPSHKIDISRPVRDVFGRYHMAAQEGGFGRELGGDLKCPELVGKSEPVATLDLYGGGT